MNISVTLTKSEFQNVLLKHFIETYFNYKRLIIVMFIFLLLSIQVGGFEEGKAFEIFILYPLCGLILYALCLSMRFWIPFIKFKKIMDPKTLIASYNVSNNVDNLKVETIIGQKVVFWRKIINIKKVKNHLVISLLDNSTYIIPESQFDDEAAINDFVQSVQNGIIKTRGTLSVSIFLRPPYLLGLICFIPLFGLIVGIVLVLLGLFHYKDKLLVLIGCLGVIFTIGYYKYTFPDSERDKQFAKISQMQLNSLIKDIEYYKLQNGNYPDKLEQLQNSNSMVLIYDPLQPKNGKSSKFNYILVGDRYKLFSSGIDGIANTKDDIFPEVEDISKVGLIK